MVQVAGRVLYLALSLLTTKLLTGYLGTGGYGQYNIIVDYMGFFGVMVDMGLYLIVIQHVEHAKSQADKEKAVGNIVGLRIISAVIMFAVASGLIFLVPSSSYSLTLKYSACLAAVAFFCVSLSQLFAGVFQAYLHAEWAALSEVIGKVVVLATVFVCARENLGLEALAVSLIIGNGASFIFSFAMAKRFVNFKLHFDWASYRQILKEAAPLGLVLALSYAYVKQDTIILSLHPGLKGISHDVAVGIYKVPYRLLEVIQGFPALFLTALFPFMNKYIVGKDSRLFSMYQKAFDFLVALALPMIVGVVVLAHALIPFITKSGTQWTPAVLTMQILIFSVAFAFIDNYAGFIIISQKKQKYLIGPNIMYLVFNLVLNIIVIPFWSYNGAAIVTVWTEMLVCATNFIIIYKLMHWYPKLHALVKICGATAVMGVVVYALDRIGLYFLLNGALSMAVYFVVLSALGGLPEGITARALLAKLVNKSTV